MIVEEEESYEAINGGGLLTVELEQISGKLSHRKKDDVKLTLIDFNVSRKFREKVGGPGGSISKSLDKNDSLVTRRLLMLT